MKKIIKKINSISGIFLTIFQHTRGAKYKLKFSTYIFRNALGRIIPSLKSKKDIFLKMDELNFYFAPSQSELSPYPEIFHEKVYEKDQRFLPNKGDTIIDVGGHIGFFTIAAARRCGEKGRIYTFEPNPDTFKRLIKNIKANNLSQVETNNIAISKKEGVLNLKVGDSTEGSTIMSKGKLKEYERNISVVSNTLDNIVLEKKIKKIDLLKIDAEGAEVLILKGAENHALSITEKILIETHSKELRKKCKNMLQSNGFECVLNFFSGVSDLGECNLVYFKR